MILETVTWRMSYLFDSGIECSNTEIFRCFVFVHTVSTFGQMDLEWLDNSPFLGWTGPLEETRSSLVRVWWLLTSSDDTVRALDLPWTE